MNLQRMNTDMVRIDRISADDAPCSYYARVYLNNEYQAGCCYAAAVEGFVRRMVMRDGIKILTDPLGGKVVRTKYGIAWAPNGHPYYEDVYGDVKIFAPKECVLDLLGKIPETLPNQFYTEKSTRAYVVCENRFKIVPFKRRID